MTKNKKRATLEQFSQSVRYFGSSQWVLTESVLGIMYDLFLERFTSDEISLLDLRELYDDAASQVEAQEDKYNEYEINVQFEVMRRATAVCLPDSVFYHACSGIGKDIDFVYFGRGREVYERVKNLNFSLDENVFFDLPEV